MAGIVCTEAFLGWSESNGLVHDIMSYESRSWIMSRRPSNSIKIRVIQWTRNQRVKTLLRTCMPNGRLILNSKIFYWINVNVMAWGSPWGSPWGSDFNGRCYWRCHLLLHLLIVNIVLWSCQEKRLSNWHQNSFQAVALIYNVNYPTK